MKAIQIKGYGGSDLLEMVDISPPQLKPKQILVEIHAVSINPFDWKLRAGYLKDMIPLQFPVTVGGDFSGVVTQAEGSVFKVGDEVFGSAITLNGSSGAFAELAAVNEGSCALKPKNSSFEEAASLPLVGVSAIQALEEHMKLQSGQKILIHGGAGGIGSIAIQVAKALGAYVATTASSENREFVQSLGADLVVDYKKEKFEDMIKEYDAVFDTVGGETTDRSFQVLKKGGVLVSMNGVSHPQKAQELGITAIAQATQIHTAHLSRLVALVEGGKVKPMIDRSFPFDKTREAFDYQENEGPRGKVVVTVK